MRIGFSFHASASDNWFLLARLVSLAVNRMNIRALVENPGVSLSGNIRLRLGALYVYVCEVLCRYVLAARSE